MPLTQVEIDAFRDFAMHKVYNGGVNSLADCLRMWEEEREYEETVAAIKEGWKTSLRGGRCRSIRRLPTFVANSGFLTTLSPDLGRFGARTWLEPNFDEITR